VVNSVSAEYDVRRRHLSSIDMPTWWLSRTRLFFAGLLAAISFVAAAQLNERVPALSKVIAAAQREGSVVVYSTMDAAEASPLIGEFESRYPGVHVQYHEMNSPEVYGRFIVETERDGASADVTWSSAMDLQLKLANDGYAATYRSPHAQNLPEWAVWRDEAYGTTFEPAVFVYNRRHVSAAEVPHTHADFLRLLKSRHDKYSGNVITYDIEKSAVGFLFLTQDSLAMPDMWELIEQFGQANVELEANTAVMMERIASGKDLIGYNLIGSYALARAKRDPSLGVVLPADYTLVLSRVILIARKAPHPNAARLWLDFVLSRHGQTVLAEKSRVFSVRPDVRGEFTAASLSESLGKSARPIAVGPGLLVFLDKAKHLEIIKRWRRALANP
jgi:iron(III) transport system substrate-binding protein